MKAETVLNFHFPVRKKQVFVFSWICLSLSFFCLSAAAFEDSQEAVDSRRLVKQAEKLVRRGSLSEAETLLRRAVELDPRESKAKTNLSYLLIKQRRFPEAYEIAAAVAEAGHDRR